MHELKYVAYFHDDPTSVSVFAALRFTDAECTTVVAVTLDLILNQVPSSFSFRATFLALSERQPDGKSILQISGYFSSVQRIRSV